MKKLIALCLVTFTINATAQFLSKGTENYALSTEKYINFIPIAPIQVQSDITSATSNNRIKTQTALEMSMDKKAVLNFIPNESMETTLQSFSNTGGVSYLYSGRSVKKGTYRLIVDYNKYII
jgi:hypothetical protein